MWETPPHPSEHLLGGPQESFATQWTLPLPPESPDKSCSSKLYCTVFLGQTSSLHKFSYTPLSTRLYKILSHKVLALFFFFNHQSPVGKPATGPCLCRCLMIVPSRRRSQIEYLPKMLGCTELCFHIPTSTKESGKPVKVQGWMQLCRHFSHILAPWSKCVVFQSALYLSEVSKSWGSTEVSSCPWWENKCL